MIQVAGCKLPFISEIYNCIYSKKIVNKVSIIIKELNCNQGPVVRKVDSAIHRIVIFSTVVKMLQKL